MYKMYIKRMKRCFCLVAFSDPIQKKGGIHEGLLTPRESSICWWKNEHHVADMEFLAKPNIDSFLPHAEFGVVPEEVLSEFVENRAGTFFATEKLIGKLEAVDQARVAEEVVQRANAFSSTYQTKYVDGKKWRHTFKSCPVVWDTGASAGLTLFGRDFTDCMG